VNKKQKKQAKPILIGSVVQLKSGGPLMTVVNAVSNQAVVLTVLWVGQNNAIHKADIGIQALKLIK
jgi:hypothetical protein